MTELKLIPVPELDAGESSIEIAVLTSSKVTPAAQEFTQFVASPKAGLAIFKEKGFRLISPAVATATSQDQGARCHQGFRQPTRGDPSPADSGQHYFLDCRHRDPGRPGTPVRHHPVCHATSLTTLPFFWRPPEHDPVDRRQQALPASRPDRSRTGPPDTAYRRRRIRSRSRIQWLWKINPALDDRRPCFTILRNGLCDGPGHLSHELHGTGRIPSSTNVGFVFQMFHLLPYLTVLDNVLVAAGNTDIEANRARATELLEQFSLEDRLLHRPGQLSAGERQRVAMARALLPQPRLLLADEPTGNLDPENAAAVLQLLQQFHEQGGTILLVTHDEQAASHAARTIVLSDGKLVEESAATAVVPEG